LNAFLYERSVTAVRAISARLLTASAQTQIIARAAPNNALTAAATTSTIAETGHSRCPQNGQKILDTPTSPGRDRTPVEIDSSESLNGSLFSLLDPALEAIG